MTERLLQVATAPFEAARRIPGLPDGHRARRLHGHSFLASVQAALPAGWAPFRGAELPGLRAALDACIAPLDYRDLNAVLAQPTDADLAAWVLERLSVPGAALVSIQSGPEQGAQMDAAGRVQLWRRFRFEAAHRLPYVPEWHQCGRMHGHGFEVILHTAGGEDGPQGQDRLAVLWEPLGAELHHACLNDIPGLENPTSELLARWIWQRLAPEGPVLSWVTVYETATAGCHYDGQRYRIWKDQRFEGALRLLTAPEGDPRRRLHGHSYLLRLYLTAPLDDVLGWTVDYGEVKARFKPLYERLDHHRLDALPLLAAADPGTLALWLREAIAAELPQLDRIDVYETPGCGAALCWGGQSPVLPT